MNACKHFTELIDASKMDHRVLYHFIDHTQDYVISKDEFMRLRWFNSEAVRKGVADVREMLMRRFKSNAADAFQRLKSEAVKAAEAAGEKKPKLETNFQSAAQFMQKVATSKATNDLAKPSLLIDRRPALSLHSSATGRSSPNNQRKSSTSSTKE